jgi:hypothetical protein
MGVVLSIFPDSCLFLYSCIPAFLIHIQNQKMRNTGRQEKMQDFSIVPDSRLFLGSCFPHCISVFPLPSFPFRF